MCGACVSTVTPILNQVTTIRNWKVDTLSPLKTLTVEVDDSFKTEDVISTLKNTGYIAELTQ